MASSNGKQHCNVIFAYTQAQAIEDGVLIVVGYCGKEKVVLTRNLFYDGYEDLLRRRELVMKGLELLKLPDAEDSEYMKLRVIEKDKLWVIWSAGEGFVFMKPEDY